MYIIQIVKQNLINKPYVNVNVALNAIKIIGIYMMVVHYPAGAEEMNRQDNEI